MERRNHRNSGQRRRLPRHYWLKQYGEPGEEYGLNGGRLSKLTLKLNGKWIANYDKGWDIEPTCEAANLALCILLNEHN